MRSTTSAAAETLAYQRATEKGEGGEPLEGDKLEAAQTKFPLADAYRTAIMGKDQKAKEQARKDIDAARKAGTISVNDEQHSLQVPDPACCHRRPPDP